MRVLIMIIITKSRLKRDQTNTFIYFHITLNFRCSPLPHLQQKLHELPISMRNWKQYLCETLGETRCIVGNVKVISYPDLPQPTDRVRSGYGICTDSDRFHRLSFLFSQKPMNSIFIWNEALQYSY